jgi:hypothetical protein
MNEMCALKSSGDHFEIPQSPSPFGAFIISMNFMVVAGLDRKSEPEDRSRHPG